MEISDYSEHWRNAQDFDSNTQKHTGIILIANLVKRTSTK